MTQGLIFNVQPFSLQDGPGTRTTVFLKGCNLRCRWCHNPESQSAAPEILFRSARCIGCGACAEVCPSGADGRAAYHTDKCVLCGACARACYADALVLSGEKIDPETLCARVLADKAIFDRSGGGATFSGGEPLLQPDFLRETLTLLKAAGVHTAAESALHVPWETVASLLPLVDLWFVDVKCMDDARHRAGTFASNARILANIARLSESGARIVLRTPVVPGFNDDLDEMAKIAAFEAGLAQKHDAELLAFHGMCSGKYGSLGRAFWGEGRKTPGADDMRAFAAPFIARGLNVKIR